MRKVKLVEPIELWREAPAPRDPRRTFPEGAKWVPPSEDPWYREKWRLARERAAQGLIDLTPEYEERRDVA